MKSNKSSLFRRLRSRAAVERAVVRPSFELMEPRMLFSVAATAANVPQLSSLPTAHAKLYLDFSGQPASTWSWMGTTYSVPATPAYTSDSDATTFSTTDLANIREIWARVAEMFSPLNLDVTTVNPGSFPTGGALHMIVGGDDSWLLGHQHGDCGVSNWQGFYNSGPSGNSSTTGYLFSGNTGAVPATTADDIAFQVGMAFGVDIQAVWNSSGIEVTGFNPGNSAIAPLMGAPSSSQRAVWWVGANGINQPQDDLALMAGINDGFGYRADNYGGTSTSNAAPLTVSGNTCSASGIIVHSNDNDYYSFSTAGGQVTVAGNVGQTKTSDGYTVSDGAMLGMQLHLFNQSGQLVATANSTATLGQTISLNLAAGTYYVEVSGQGLQPCYDSTGTFVGSGYNVGQYQLNVSAAAVGSQPLTAPAGLTATANGSQITLNWTTESGATSYNIYRSTTSGAETLVYSGDTTSSYVANLASGYTYYFKVTAYNGSESPMSSEVSATTGTTTSAPAQVTGLTATGGTGQVALSWAAASGASSYSIYRSTSSGAETLLLSGLTATSYVNTSLSAATYYYKVCANNSAGSGAMSAEVNATATAAVTIPATPTGVSAIGGTAQVAVSWGAASGAASYNLYRSTSSGAETLLVSGLTSTSYTNTNLTAGTYYYKVAAVNSAGTSSLSTEVYAVATALVTAPPAPVGVSATGGVAQVTVSWGAVSGASSYNLYRSTTSGAETLLVSGITSTSYTNSSLSAGTYFYKVCAVNSAGAGAMSTEVSATATAAVTVPTAPLGVGAVGGNGVITVSWGAVSGATSYDVYRASSSGAETLFASGITTTSYANSGLVAGSTFFYQVSAVNSAGEGSKSAQVSATTQSAPAQVTGLIVSGGTAQATLSWAATTGASSYNIYRSTTSGGETLLAAGVTSTVYTNSSLAGGTYYYKVAAVNSAGTGAMSAEGVATVTNAVTTPAAPTGVGTSAGVRVVTVSWGAVSGATSYNVYRSTSSGAETLVISGLTSTSYSDSGLANGTTYYYKVSASNSAGTGALSNEVTATTTAVPAQVTGLTATGSTSQVALSWSVASGATSYNIYRSTISGSETLLVSGVTSTSYTNTSLTAGTYFYKVCAVNIAGSGTMSAEASATATALVTTPAAPTSVTATHVNNTTATINWTASTTNVTGFVIQYSTDGGKTWLSLTTVTSNTATSYTATGLNRKATYTFRVASYNSAGTSLYTVSNSVRG